MFKYFYLILSIPKTIFFNFKYLKFKDAIKLPVFIYYKVYLKELKGEVKIQSTIKRGMIRIGFGNVTIFDKHNSRTIWQVGSGRVVFKGKASIGHGSKIAVGGDLIFGNDFVITAETKIICAKKIVFGSNCVLSWDSIIMDTDFHKIYDRNNNIINPDKEIVFGDNIWVGCNCTILKGTKVSNNTVIAAASTLVSVYEKGNAIIGGVPASILKNNIYWEK